MTPARGTGDRGGRAFLRSPRREQRTAAQPSGVGVFRWVGSEPTHQLNRARRGQSSTSSAARGQVARSVPARQIEETLGQRCQVALHLLDVQDIGVLRLYVAQVDGVTGLGTVEARLLRDGDAEVVA